MEYTWGEHLEPAVVDLGERREGMLIGADVRSVRFCACSLSFESLLRFEVSERTSAEVSSFVGRRALKGVPLERSSKSPFSVKGNKV